MRQHSITPALLTAFVLLGSSPTRAADATHGGELARRWCASCHLVGANQTTSAEAPSFATIGSRPGFDAGNLALFLLDPHPKMPNMSLTRNEANDLAAYIASLAK